MTPLHELSNHPGATRGIRLFMKRDDLIHKTIEGTKFRKLEPYIQKLKSENLKGLISLGGPFSNHLHALAHAGLEFNFSTVGIIRGLHLDFENPTLKICREKRMTLHPVSIDDFDKKNVASIVSQYAEHFVVPFGAESEMAVQSCEKIAVEIEAQLPAYRPIIVVSAGTGTTAAGIIRGAKRSESVLVVPVTSRSPTKEDVEEWVGTSFCLRWKMLEHEFRHFAKPNEKLFQFAKAFEVEHGIRLDPIYTAKMMFVLFQKLEREIEDNAVVVAVHTGGMQGWAGFL